MNRKRRAGIVILALTGSVFIIINSMDYRFHLVSGTYSFLFYLLQPPVFGCLTAVGIYLVVTGKKSVEIQDDALQGVDNKDYRDYISYRRKLERTKEVIEAAILIIGLTLIVIARVNELTRGSLIVYPILFGTAIAVFFIEKRYLTYAYKKANKIIERGGISDLVEKMKAVEMQLYAQKQDKKSGNSNSKESFGCGIVSIVFSFTAVIGIIFGITAIVVAQKAKKADHPYMGGLITGITGTAESLIIAIIILISAIS